MIRRTPWFSGDILLSFCHHKCWFFLYQVRINANVFENINISWWFSVWHRINYLMSSTYGHTKRGFIGDSSCSSLQGEHFFAVIANGGLAMTEIIRGNVWLTYCWCIVIRMWSWVCVPAAPCQEFGFHGFDFVTVLRRLVEIVHLLRVSVQIKEEILIIRGGNY